MSWFGIRDLESRLDRFRDLVYQKFKIRDSQLDHLVRALGFYGFDSSNDLIKTSINPLRDIAYEERNQPATKCELSNLKRDYEDKFKALCDYLGVEVKGFYEVHPPVMADVPYVVVKKKKSLGESSIGKKGTTGA